MQKNKEKKGNTGGSRAAMKGDLKELSMDFVVRVPQLKTFEVAQKYGITAFSNSAAVTTYGGFSLNVGQMPDIASFAAIFDRYKILKAEIYFTPYLATEVVQSTPVPIPRLHSVIDLDDESAPTSIAELEQYSTYGAVRGTAPMVRVFRPKPIMQIYQSAVATSYATAPDVWLDLANTSIPHYGIKYAFAQSTNAATFGYEIVCVLTASFANVR